MSFDTPDLRLVDDDGDGDDPMPAAPDAGVGERSHADLVSEVIGEAGLLPADKLAQVRRQAVDTSFSQALVDEGLASSLGVARALAEQYHLPLVDLAVAGVDDAAAKTIALPVLERVCAIPFASEGDDPQGRDHRPAERAGPRRAAARDPATDRVLRRGQERRPHRAAPALARRPRRSTPPSRRPPPRSKRRRTTSRPTTASPTRRSSGSSTRSSSRPPRRARATSTSSRRRTSSSSATGSTASSTSPSGSRRSSPRA